MALDLDRLKKFMLVMLSSDKPGEVMSASAMVVKALKKEGRDIHWLVDQLTGKEAKPAQPTLKHEWNTPLTDWQDQLAVCYEQRHLLQFREKEFIISLMAQCSVNGSWWAPSPRQESWLLKIYSKLRLYA